MFVIKQPKDRQEQRKLKDIAKCSSKFLIPKKKFIQEDYPNVKAFPLSGDKNYLTLGDTRNYSDEVNEKLRQDGADWYYIFEDDARLLLEEAGIINPVAEVTLPELYKVIDSHIAFGNEKYLLKGDVIKAFSTKYYYFFNIILYI